MVWKKIKRCSNFYLALTCLPSLILYSCLARKATLNTVCIPEVSVGWGLEQKVTENLKKKMKKRKKNPQTSDYFILTLSWHFRSIQCGVSLERLSALDTRVCLCVSDLRSLTHSSPFGCSDPGQRRGNSHMHLVSLFTGQPTLLRHCNKPSE